METLWKIKTLSLTLDHSNSHDDNDHHDEKRKKLHERYKTLIWVLLDYFSCLEEEFKLSFGK